MREVVQKISPANRIARPNTFEFEGNKEIKFNMLARNQPYSLCLNWPVSTVITVNKVQDVYNTPVYRLSQVEESKEADPKADEAACLEYMNTLLESGHSIDLAYYREQIFSSVHVGDFITKTNGQTSGFTALNAPQPSVAVVMPVFNTSPHFLNEAIDSIVVAQTYKGALTLIIVDDGSTNMRTVQCLQ